MGVLSCYFLFTPMQPYFHPTTLRDGEDEFIMNLLSDEPANLFATNPGQLDTSNLSSRQIGKTKSQSSGNRGRTTTAPSYPTTPNTPEKKKKKTGAPKQRCYKKRRTEGLEGFLASGPTIDEAIAAGLIPPLPIGESKEVRKERRLIRNRVSAQLHRERKKLYVENLESRVQEQASDIFTLEQTVRQLQRQNTQLREAAGIRFVGGMNNMNNNMNICNTGSISSARSTTPETASSTPMHPLSNASHSGSDTDMELSPSNSVNEKEEEEEELPFTGAKNNMNKIDQSVNQIVIENDGSSTPEQLAAFADDLGLGDFDPDGAYAAAAANDFAGFSSSTNGLLQLDTQQDLLNAPLLSTPTSLSSSRNSSSSYQQNNSNSSNPKKRPFFMMGMFFFVALFGGAGIFGANQQSDSLSSVGGSSGLSMALHTNSQTARTTTIGRKLLSDTTDNDSENDVKSTFDSDKTAVALWSDLEYIHTNTNVSHLCKIDDLLDSVVNATTLAQGKLMQPPSKSLSKKKNNNNNNNIRGVAGKAVVPYSTDSSMAVSTTTTNVLTSALTLQRQMADHDSNTSSTILCPKPYGRLNGAFEFDDDSNIKLLLPSSSLSSKYDGGKTNEDDMEWDGTWVEVEAKITGVRKVPMYTHQGISAPTSTHRAIPL